MAKTPGRSGPPYKCIGFRGKILGHVFKKTLGCYDYGLDYCARCGMPVGGWKNNVNVS